MSNSFIPKPPPGYIPFSRVNNPESFDVDADSGIFDDSPFCECNLDPTEDELVDNVCDVCGRPLE